MPPRRPAPATPCGTERGGRAAPRGAVRPGAMRRPKQPALLLIDLVNHFDFPGGDALGRATRRIVLALLRLRQRFERAGQGGSLSPL